MKYLKISLKVFFVVLLVLITASFSIKDSGVKTINSNVISSYIAGTILDHQTLEYEKVDFDSIKKQIENDKYALKISEKCLNSAIKGNGSKLDITKESTQLVNKLLPNDSQDKKDKLVECLQYDAYMMTLATDKCISNSIFINLYALVTNVLFIIFMSILLILDLIALFILERKNILRIVQRLIIATILVSIWIEISILFFWNFFIKKVPYSFLKNMNTKLDLHMLEAFIIIEILICFVIYLYKKFAGNKSKTK